METEWNDNAQDQTMIMRARFTLVVALCGISVASGAKSGEPCPCMYETHPDNEAECRVYGKVGNEDAFPWLRATDRCTDALGLDIRPYGTDWLWLTCPHTNGTDANVDAIVNLIRSNEAPLSEEVRAKYPSYFVQEGNGTQLVEEIFSGQGISLDCAKTVSFCWSEIKIFFTQHPSETVDLCTKLHDRQKPTLANEQTTARQRLCKKDEVMLECREIHRQVLEVKESSGGCDAVEAQASTDDIPALDTCGIKEEEPDSGSSLVRATTWLFLLLLIRF